MVTSRKPIVVIGGGGHARVLISMLGRMPHFDVLGYVDPQDHGIVYGKSRLGDEGILPSLAARGGISAVIGVGKIRAGGARLKIFENLLSLGFELPVLVAPTAMVAAESTLGAGTVVLDGAIVQPGCVVGRAAILNSGCCVEHDCILGDDVHIASGAALSGAARVGDRSLVGIGASVVQGVHIGADCTIGAGAAVVEDCNLAGVYVGVPAKRISE